MVYRLLHHASAQNPEVQMPMVEHVTLTWEHQHHSAKFSNYGTFRTLLQGKEKYISTKLFTSLDKHALTMKPYGLKSKSDFVWYPRKCKLHHAHVVAT